MWREARNVWILLKPTFVDNPSTPRERARRLRREQTEAERFLFPFIADFCCLEHRLIIELDGGQHACGVGKEKDEAVRDFLKKQGYEVVRFWGHEVVREVQFVLQK